MFDGLFIPAQCPDSKWQHEDASRDMFYHLIDSNNLEDEFTKYGLKQQDRVFITELIAGPQNGKQDQQSSWPYEGRDKEKGYLYEIIANKRNGIDVDKMDYFARDCHYLGIRKNFDHKRFMQFARVMRVDGELQMCSRDKEVDCLYDMFALRSQLHRRAYQHKNKKIIELMITEAMIKADEHIRIQGQNGAMLKMSECIHDTEAYTKLTDSIFHQILYSTEPELKEAREILKRIQSRDLYKCIGQTSPLEKSMDLSRESRKEMEQAIAAHSKHLSAEHLQLQTVSLDFGMKSKNPIEHMRFYSKSDPSRGFQIESEERSLQVPSTFSEKRLRLFCVMTGSEEILENARSSFRQWCQQNNLMMGQADNNNDRQLNSYN